MKYKLKDISKGDSVTVDNKIKGTVDTVEKDIKNGIPGITYTSEDKKKLFCYLEQVTDLVKKLKAIKVQTVEKTINRPTLEDLDIGDRVTVNVNGGGTRSGVIEDVIPEIKNGRDGISYDCDTEGSCWAYVEQIQTLVKQIPVEKKAVKRKM
jgi:hypothetical protein